MVLRCVTGVIADVVAAGERRRHEMAFVHNRLAQIGKAMAEEAASTVVTRRQVIMRGVRTARARHAGARRRNEAQAALQRSAQRAVRRYNAHNAATRRYRQRWRRRGAQVAQHA